MKYMYEAIVKPVGDGYEARLPEWDAITQGVDGFDVAFMAQDLLENLIMLALEADEELPTPYFDHDISGSEWRLAVVVECDEHTPQVETMTVADAADLLGVSAGRVRAMIKSGILESHKIGAIHQVTTASVMERFNNPRPAGRPYSRNKQPTLS